MTETLDIGFRSWGSNADLAKERLEFFLREYQSAQNHGGKEHNSLSDRAGKWAAVYLACQHIADRESLE